MRGFFVADGRTNISGHVTFGKPTLHIGIRRLAMAKVRVSDYLGSGILMFRRMPHEVPDSV